MAQLVTVRLSRSDAQPWGFRLQGGKDFGTPLVVQKVAGGSIAANAGLVAGDAVIKVNGMDVYNLRHKDAQDAVVRGGNNFEISVQRGGSTWRPTVSPAGSLPQPVLSGGSVAPVTHTSLAAKPQEVSHIGSGYNSSARPYLPSVNGDGVKSIVNKQYNTPVGMYSDETIAETLSAQAEVLAGGVLGVNFKKNERIYNSANSEVYKMLQEAENDPNDPEESSFSPTPYQSSNQQSSPSGGVTKHVTAPVAQAKPPNTGGLPAGQNICAECERLIVGVFVRIKEKNLHVDCFKCATCGTPLKNQGYFNINNKLYCDIHAKLAALNNPPPGTEGYLPVPIKPNTKLSASTISAALTTHHGTGAGATNGAPQLGSPLSTGSNTNLSCATNFASNSCVLPQALSSCESTPKKLSPMASVGVSPIHSRQNSLGSAMSDTDINHKNVYNILKNCQSDDTPGHRRTYLETDFTDTISECDSPDEGTRMVMVGHEKMQNGTHNSEFVYKTIGGGIIRSVQAPGKGKNINYKINTNISGPKPFNISSAPLSPPSAGPKSPSIYPPPTSAAAWSQPKPPSTFEAPKPSTFGSSTLPRANVGPAAPGSKGGAAGVTSAPKRGRGVLNKAVGPGGRIPQCGCCNQHIRGPFITALGRIWCPDHFICVNGECRRPLADIGFVEEKGNLYCEYCFEKYIAPSCSKCGAKIKGDCLNAIGKHFHPECFTCAYCGKLFGNSPFFLEEGNPYCEADWNEMFTTKCFACGFPVEAGDRWVEALSHNYHSQCFNCTTCKKNLEGQSFFAKGGRPYCKNHAR
ncbi:PDZ and LIM domain protein Zasp isoform X20 [Lutzomyia longipalpis]|uniref:PDZ and LIM domain protein Zasp isoform X20 n=1 Tax=Lutzomyia longipalpis TaxID=7200 RepID=UPI002483561B|nr:PDZ and LIM domain protein Zasp isoform X20 [Lutzomyia longipalpis]